MVNQSSISLSLEDFMIADVQSSNISSPNQTFIYFKLHVEDAENDLSVHYGNLSLTFSYYRTSDNIVPLDKSRDLMAGNFQELDALPAVAFRVDLAGVVRFSELNIKSKKLKVMAGAKVEVDPVTGRRNSKKAIQLKHSSKHHVSGSVTFFFVFMIIATIFSPLWCCCFVECFRQCRSDD